MKLRVGVVGVGSLGIHHVRCLSQSERAKLIGIYEHHPDRAERAIQYGAKLFPDLNSLLSQLDAVVVSTPTRGHREVAGAALQSGLHCFVEKPLAADSRECDELVELADRYRRILHVGHVERMNPAIRAIYPEITRPLYVDTQRLSPFVPRGIDVDVIFDLMIHDLDLILEWTGEEPNRVSAVGTRVISGEVDIANVHLEFPSGCVANLTASRVSPERHRQIRIFQPGSYYSVNSLNSTAERIRVDQATIASLRSGYDTPTAAATAVAREMDRLVKREEIATPVGEPIALELDAFLRACNGEPPLDSKPANGKAGRRAVQLAERVGAEIRGKTQTWVL